MSKRPAVLVTGVGGGVGQSILKCCENTGWRVVAADASDLAAGLYASATAYLVPYARDPAYLASIEAICAREEIDFVFPGLDAELPVLARGAGELRRVGATAVVSSPEVVDLCDDKLATAGFLRDSGLPSLETIPAGEAGGWAAAFPVVLKPRIGGCRSIGVHTAMDAGHLSRLLERVDPGQYVVQEHVEGDEYTCGTVNFDGRCHGPIVMRRILRDGDTHKAFVVDDAGISSTVRRAAERLRPFGPCNFQLRVRDGRPHVFEINARCSGTSAARALAGFNEPKMTVDYLGSGRSPSFRVREMTILRYWNELVVANDEVETLRREGSRRGGHAHL